MLVGAYEITERLAFRRVQDVHYLLRTDASFPRPVYPRGEPKGVAKVWYWPDVQRWARRAGLVGADGAPSGTPLRDRNRWDHASSLDEEARPAGTGVSRRSTAT